ncbi:uncharacterized protein LOC128253534 [Drosophila gunungcola]|uniref:Fibrous sheath-interacting protein 2 n=1 Tax=Drosophila gunungcola TaxID=103775 RepID=A0A9Q0BKG7_9MUSC|nr:uncharacterized protein LOC128253534 [Drosophila gunungcola]KAI8034940.1 hypothetical protein M5D96_012287 [Drosophila gunungcola]
MIDILSLPRRNKVSGNPALLKMISYKTGLPINSLPGWELIPLNCKLPMLKCPGNQVIFSKNKIGQDFKSGKQEFECSVTEHIPEYNPLHDSNLKTFYSNERNLKRLRENGEITQGNDVICNLKDFNQHRQELHKSQLYYVLQAYKRRESEQYDRMLIANAESITKKDHQNLAARHQCTEEVLARKQQQEEERHERKVHLLNITYEKFKRLENLATMQNMLLEHRKMLTNMRVTAHISMCQDLKRKLLIKQKKLFQFKKDRFNKNMRVLRKQRLMKTTEHQIQSWKKRLDERIANQRRINYLLQEVEKERVAFIDRHKALYREKWQRIQDEINSRAQQAVVARQPKKKRRKKKKSASLQARKPSFCDEYQATFEGLLDSELCYALNAAIAMEGQTALSFAPDDPIYKAAQYILDHIIAGFNEDLSEDECALQVLMSRIKDFVCDAKKYVHYKACQIIGFARDHKAMEVPPSMAKPQKNHSRVSHVSFSGVASTIGVGSYEIHPFVDVRRCSERRATPAGSLASLVVSQIGEQVIQDKVRLPHLNRNQIVFIEHYLVKFKRDLLVGLDKLVFAAIQCHFENRMMEVREELLLLDRNYLFDQIAQGILSYAVNPLNYQSVLKLAVSVLSCEIIWELQQTMLKPGIDPRGQNHPVSCGTERERENLALCIP